MNKRNVIIAMIVITIVTGGLAIWSSSPRGMELVNKIEKKIHPDTYQNWKEEAKESIKERSIDADGNVSRAIEETEALIKKYESKMKEVKKKGGEQLDEYYVNLQAQAALLKAKLAAESKDTYDQAYKNLEEAKRWYNHNNYEASIRLDSTTQKVIVKINEAQEYLKGKKDEAGVLISDILSKTSELVKDDEQ